MDFGTHLLVGAILGYLLADVNTALFYAIILAATLPDIIGEVIVINA